MGRINLTDRFIQSRKAAAPGHREDHFDAIVPGLGLRVTDRGNKSFVLLARYPLRPLRRAAYAFRLSSCTCAYASPTSWSRSALTAALNCRLTERFLSPRQSVPYLHGTVSVFASKYKSYPVR